MSKEVAGLDSVKTLSVDDDYFSATWKVFKEP